MGSLLAGIILSVVMTLLLEKVVRYYLKHLDRGLISSVFPFTKSDNSLEVKCSLNIKQDGKNPSSLRAYVHSAETLALQKIAKHLHGHDIELTFSSFYSIPQEEKNLLLIGTDPWSS